MQTLLKAFLTALIFANVPSGTERAYAAGPAVDFLDEIFRQEDLKRKRIIERPVRSAPGTPRPVRPRVEISETTFAPAELPKSVEAKTVLVIGDEMAMGLAEGLRQIYATDPSTAVRALTRPGVGIVSGAAADWATLTREALVEGHPAAIIVMFGLSDRQALIDGDRIVDFRDARWRDIYQARVDAFLAQFGDARARLYWTGLPIMRAAKDATDASQFSDIFKSRVFTASARFVDVWEGFVDEDGKYVAVGPDVNGNKRRLRKSDGIGLTPAGNRKLAFFVEEALKRDGKILETPLLAGLELPARREDVAPLTIPLVPQTPQIAALAPNYVGQIVQITPIPLKSGAELATGEQPRGDFASQVLLRGDPAPMHAGRADDANWQAREGLAIAPTPSQEQARTQPARPTL